MGRRYGEAILVRRAPAAQPADSASGAERGERGPASFAWRGVWYRVDAIIATWRLRDRWWAGGTGALIADVADVAEVTEDSGMGGGSGPQADVLPATERIYYRVVCRDPQGIQVFDLYYDAASGQWMLDRAHD